MAEQMKGITCCGDCVYYNWKKHKCSRGASIETDARKHFYDDCPMPDVFDEKEIRNKAIDDVFDFLKTKRDTKNMKVNFDDLEIRKYKEQMKGGAV